MKKKDVLLVTEVGGTMLATKQAILYTVEPATVQDMKQTNYFKSIN